MSVKHLVSPVCFYCSFWGVFCSDNSLPEVPATGLKVQPIWKIFSHYKQPKPWLSLIRTNITSFRPTKVRPLCPDCVYTCNLGSDEIAKSGNLDLMRPKTSTISELWLLFGQVKVLLISFSNSRIKKVCNKAPELVLKSQMIFSSHWTQLT